jgi:hypothetical protein
MKLASLSFTLEVLMKSPLPLASNASYLMENAGLIYTMVVIIKWPSKFNSQTHVHSIGYIGNLVYNGRLEDNLLCNCCFGFLSCCFCRFAILKNGMINTELLGERIKTYGKSAWFP